MKIVHRNKRSQSISKIARATGALGVFLPTSGLRRQGTSECRPPRWNIQGTSNQGWVRNRSCTGLRTQGKFPEKQAEKASRAMTDISGVILEKRGQAYWITINRPDKRNAINGHVIARLGWPYPDAHGGP